MHVHYAALGQARARASAKFAELDTDRNGQIGPAECNKLIAGSPIADGRPLIGKLDGHKDGQISLAEHRAPALAQFDRAGTFWPGLIHFSRRRARPCAAGDGGCAR